MPQRKWKTTGVNIWTLNSFKQMKEIFLALRHKKRKKGKALDVQS